MKIFKIFVFLILLTFLGGCTFHHRVIPCTSLDRPNNTGHNCHYEKVVTKVNEPKEGWLKVKMSEDVLDRNKASGEKEGEDRDYSNYPRETEYSVFVGDTKGIKPGDKIKFIKRSRENKFENIIEIKKINDKPGQGNKKIK